MPNKKITEFNALTTPSNNDILPIIDISETNIANQNKKITVSNLLSLVPSTTENPYIKVTYTEDIIPVTIPNGNIVIGEDFNKFSPLPYTNRVPDGYNIVLGSNISINAPNNNNEVSGELESPYVMLIGHNNSVGNNCREASIFAQNSVISNNAWGALILGSNSIIGKLPIDSQLNNYYSIAIGDNVEVQGTNCTALGYVSKILNNSANSIAIGTAATIGTNFALFPTDSSIAIGHNINVSSNFSIALGFNSQTKSENSITIGFNSFVDTQSINNIVIGNSAIIASNVENSVQLGTGVITTSNTLQFLSKPIANNISLRLSNYAINPSTIPPAGTIIRNSTDGNIYTSNGTSWTTPATASSVIKHGAFYLIRTVAVGSQFIPANSTATLLHNFAQALTPAAGYTTLPITYSTSTGVITFNEEGMYRLVGTFSVKSAAANQNGNIMPNLISGNITTYAGHVFTTGPANEFNNFTTEIILTVDAPNTNINIRVITPVSNTASLVFHPNTAASDHSCNKISITKIS